MKAGKRHKQLAPIITTSVSGAASAAIVVISLGPAEDSYRRAVGRQRCLTA